MGFLLSLGKNRERAWLPRGWWKKQGPGIGSRWGSGEGERGGGRMSEDCMQEIQHRCWLWGLQVLRPCSLPQCETIQDPDGGVHMQTVMWVPVWARTWMYKDMETNMDMHMLKGGLPSLGASLGAQLVNNPPTMRETLVQFLGQEFLFLSFLSFSSFLPSSLLLPFSLSLSPLPSFPFLFPSFFSSFNNNSR